MILTIILDYKDNSFTFHDILVEFHGLIFDLLFLGIILTIYETFRDKKDKIERYKDEIDDLREWQSKEAKFKIIGRIKRLYNLGVTNFNLNGCYLKKGDLMEYNFTKSTFAFANLESARFTRSNLSECDFVAAKLIKTQFVDSMAYKTNFEHSDLSNSTIISSDFSYSNLQKANLNGSIIIGTDFNSANMSNANLKNIRVYDLNWFDNLKLNNVNGIEKLIEKYQICPESLETDEIGQSWIVTKKPTHNNS
mgnify:CR=1 FL=1